MASVMLVPASAALGAQRLASVVEPAELVGTWSGRLDVRGLVSLAIEIREATPGQLVARIDGASKDEDEIRVAYDGRRIRFQALQFPIAFDGWHAGDDIEAFVQHGQALFHTRLKASEHAERAWSGRWSLSGVPGGRFPVDLYIVKEDDNAFGAYLFFRDQRMQSLWTHGFESDQGSVRFREKNLGLEFAGGFDREQDALFMTATALGGSTSVSLRRLTPQVYRHSDRFLPDGDLADELQPRSRDDASFRGRAPESLADGWPTGTPTSQGIDVAHIGRLVEAIASREMTLTHGVLIARNGTLVVEEYFYGFDRDTRHDMRSASKTVAAALVGAAIENEAIPGVEARAIDYFPQYRQLAHWDVRKAQITIHDLLNMASGLDANDYEPTAAAAENAYQSQTQQPDWMRIALDAPMIADPGTQPLYGGANPLLIGGIMHAAVGGSVESFAHEHLFGPLGVENYKWFLDPTGRVYLGGGMYLRPRDMLKFGQLHLNGGAWNGRRILSEDWVRRSMAKYGRLGNVRDKNEYGYLWWHRDYAIGDRIVASIEARGAGGQYLFVVPALDLVAVVTSGNYRNGRFRQPEDIMERYILPAAAGTFSKK
jgi:CubicO group peptidase (beta-lactamase class C family)